MVNRKPGMERMRTIFSNDKKTKSQYIIFHEDTVRHWTDQMGYATVNIIATVRTMAE